MTSQDLFDVPVVLCVYNRPNLTAQVLATLRAVRPRHMLVVADGPKGDARDRELCEAVIGILRTVDWPAVVEWDISPVNLGTRKRIQSGLSWAFSRVEQAVILEDDCVPDASFFRFCAELLARYRDDERVALISGTNFQFGTWDRQESYVFSRYPLIWGWSTWRRSWERYDADLDAWPALRPTGWLLELLGDPLAAAYWRQVFDRTRAGFDTWDFQLTFSCWRSGALAIHPTMNLVRNIGFGPDATRARDPRSVFANMEAHRMLFPLAHPERIARSAECDLRIEQVAFSTDARQQLGRLLAARRAGTASTTWTPG